MARRELSGRFRLPADHRWKARPGYQIVVADRGAVRFDVPRDWVMAPAPSSLKLHDRQPPDDECTLEMSFLMLPPVDLSALPVATMLRETVEQEERGNRTWTGEIVEERRGDLEIAQYASRWVDSSQMREACSHVALARRNEVQALLTFDYWLDDARQFGPVWLDVIDSLRVGEWVTPDGRPAGSLPPRRPPRDRRQGRA